MGGLLRSGAVISAMTMISRVLGLVRDMVFFHLFAVGGATDAFVAANRIPNLLRRLVAEGAFSLAFVPVLAEYKATKSKESTQDLIDHVAGMLFVILFFITLIGVIAAPFIITAITPGFQLKEGAEPELAGELLRITFPYILFISLSAFASGILNTWGRFAVPAFTPVLLNVVMIAAMVWWAPHFDEPIKAVAWGVFIGGIAQLLFQLPALYRLGLLPRLRFKKAHAGVKKILKLMIPALFGSSVAQVNLLLNTAIASLLGTGIISWLYSSDRFVELPLALFGVALGVIILPKLSKDYATTNKDAFSETLNWAIKLAVMVSLPAMVGLLLLAKPILVTVIYNPSAWHDVEMASLSLMTYSIGLPAFILVKILAPGFYSRQDTKTPVKVGIIALFVNMLFSIAIVYPWHKLGIIGPHAGLALSVALAGCVNAAMLYILLRKDKVIGAIAGWYGYLLKIVVALLLMAAAIWLLLPADSWWQEASIMPRLTALLGMILAAAVIYLGALLVMRVDIRQMIRHA